MSIDQLSNTEILSLFLDRWAIAAKDLAEASWTGFPCTNEQWEVFKAKAASVEDAAHEVKLLVEKGTKATKLSQDKTIQAAIATLFPELLESAEPEVASVVEALEPQS
jgi:hypothetical protein